MVALRIRAGSKSFYGNINSEQLRRILLPLILDEQVNYLPLIHMIMAKDNGLWQMIQDQCHRWPLEQYIRTTTHVTNNIPEAGRFLFSHKCGKELDESMKELLYNQFWDSRILVAIPNSFGKTTATKFIAAMKVIDDIDSYGIFRLNVKFSEIYFDEFFKNREALLSTPLYRYVQVLLPFMTSLGNEIIELLVDYAINQEDSKAATGTLLILWQEGVVQHFKRKVTLSETYFNAAMTVEKSLCGRNLIGSAPELVSFRLWLELRNSIESPGKTIGVLQKFALEVQQTLSESTDYDYVRMLELITLFPRPRQACKILVGPLRLRLLSIGPANQMRRNVFECLSAGERIEYFRRREQHLVGLQTFIFEKSSDLTCKDIISTLADRFREKPFQIHSFPAKVFLETQLEYLLNTGRNYLSRDGYTISYRPRMMGPNAITTLRLVVSVIALLKLHFSTLIEIDFIWVNELICNFHSKVSTLIIRTMLSIAYNIPNCHTFPIFRF